MDSQEFVNEIKRYAVDDTVEQVMRSLRSPRLFNVSSEFEQSGMNGLAQRMADQNREKQRRAAWFDELSEDDRTIVRQVVTECAELTGFGFMTFLDGVGGDTEGVFELVQVVGEDRNILNPENSEMLHDLFSEVCERDRGHGRS